MLKLSLTLFVKGCISFIIVQLINCLIIDVKFDCGINLISGGIIGGKMHVTMLFIT